MNRPTLASILNSRLPGLLGECTGNLNVIRSMVNEAQERLIFDPVAPDDGWWGGWATMVFTVSVSNRQGYITAAREVGRIMDLNVCATPVQIRNGFHEYQEFRTGLRSVSSCCGRKCRPMEAFERDSVATLTTLGGTRYVDIYPDDPSDVGQEVIIQGLDANSKQVIELDPNGLRAVRGEKMTLELPFIRSANQFSRIDGIMKSPTVGPLTFYQYDTASASSLPLSSMEPGETVASYRRYFLSGLPNACFGGTAGTVQVTGLVKLDLVPAMSPQDYLLIQNVPALIEEMQAIRYGSMDSPSSSRKVGEHHQMALRLLFGQLDHHLGKTKTSVSVPIWGSDRLQRQVR